MGSYCSLTLAGYEIGTSKSYIDPYWACLFNESDKRSRQVQYEQYYTEPLEEGTELVPTSEYSASVATMKLRLDIMGFTLEKVKDQFEKKIALILNDRQEFYGDDKEDYRHELNHIKALKDGGFEGWLAAIQRIITQKINFGDLSYDRDRKHDDLYSFMIEFDNILEDLFMGYPNIGFGFFLRGALETVDLDAEIILDITSLVYGGYYTDDEKVCENASNAQVIGTLEFQKIIILTEGTSDTQYLSRSLALLYPKVATYFSFLDFDTIKPDGGSGALEKTVKSFAAAGINNKLIALFDNDAVGVASVRRLKNKPLPANVRVLALPTLPLGLAYPTIGPQGATVEDINGRACSIEMYLGEDILITDEGLTPIAWRNLEHQINVYQGELTQKDEVQKRFLKKLSLSEKSEISIDGDWSGIKLIFEEIFRAASK